VLKLLGFARLKESATINSMENVFGERTVTLRLIFLLIMGRILRKMKML
jgi:hypothetical protein